MRISIKVWSWLGRLLAWMLEPSLFYHALLGMGAALAVSRYVRNELREWLAMSGSLLQLGGTLCIGIVLIRRMRRFQDDNLGQRVRDWLKRFPAFPAHAWKGVNRVPSNDISLLEGNNQWEPIPADMPVHEKIGVLDNNQHYLRQEFRRIAQLGQQEAEALRSLIATYQDRVESWMGEVEDLVEESAVGDATLELLGLFWLITGLGMGAMVRLFS